MMSLLASQTRTLHRLNKKKFNRGGVLNGVVYKSSKFYKILSILSKVMLIISGFDFCMDHCICIV